MRSTIAAVLSLALSLTFSSSSAAQAQTPNAVAPTMSFCLGESTHCVMPDFNVSAINYDLRKKKWDGGVTSVGAGYMLLFYSDQPWASGIAVHVGGKFSQSEPNYFALTPTLVACRYFEAGVTIKLVDGGVDTLVTLGVGLAWDFLTGRTMPTRLKASRTQSQGARP